MGAGATEGVQCRHWAAGWQGAGCPELGGVHDPSDPPRPLALLPTAGSFPGPELEQPDYSLEERVGARVLDDKRSRERQEQGKVQTFLRWQPLPEGH